MSQLDDYHYFKQKLPELLKEHKDEYLLIKDKREYGFYKSWEEALKEGYRLFNLGDFIIQEVTTRVNTI